MKRPAFPSVLLIASFLTTACGILPPGTYIPTDPKPVGSLVAQGHFDGMNGRTVTGMASVYQLTSDGTYVIRLEGIVVPSEGPFVVVGQAGGSEVYSQQLRAVLGTQNYVTSLGGTLTWNAVYIRSTRNAIQPDYGKAILSL